MDYAVMPPEISSGLAWTGPQAGPLTAAAAAWQALAADLAGTATAMQTAVTGLVGQSWTGPTSAVMGAAGEQHVQWLTQAAVQAQETAVLAGKAAAAVTALHAGVVPPPLIAENRATLQALIASNVLGVNSAAIAANQAEYAQMWARDATALYGYAADSAGVVGGLVPFTPMAPTVSPAGAADQAAAVGQAATQSAGNAARKAATAAGELGTTSPGAGSDIIAMAPQILSAAPQLLTGMAQPLMGGLANPMQGLGAFQSLLGPLMGGGLGNLGGVSGLAAAPAEAAGPVVGAVGAGAGLGGGLGGLGGVAGGAGGLGGALGGGAVASLGGAGKLGGLSIPATWAAGAPTTGGSSPALFSASTAGISASTAAAPGAGGVGAPLAAMGGRGASDGAGSPSYGTPIRVLPHPR